MSAKPRTPTVGQPTIQHSVEIERLQLLRHLPTVAHVYVAPFLLAYPLAIYIYTARYDDLLGDQAYTFLLCLALFGSHGLSWLGTRWSTGYRASTTAIRVRASLSSRSFARLRSLWLNASCSNPTMAD